MSAVVIGRMDVEPSIIEKLYAERADDFRTVMNEAKQRGAKHHQFLAGDGCVMLVDEWDTAEHFHEFFANQPIIADLMMSAGVSAPPEINVYEVLDSPDRF
jgi:heme-degrading monooxygenase HmoA